jgi:hypothetical protein
LICAERMHKEKRHGFGKENRKICSGGQCEWTV